MKKISTFVLSICILMFSSSCQKKESITEPNFLSTFKTKPLSFQVVENISTKIKANNSFMSLDIEKNKKTEAEFKSIVTPLINNGKEIHNELLLNLKSSQEWNSLTNKEKETLTNFSDVQLAELSLIFIELQNNITLREEDDWTEVRSCLSGALGLGELYYLLVQNPRALATARGTLSLLKHIGGRYLGYIGLGLAIYDFVDCISN
jgi:hypothetical protein